MHVATTCMMTTFSILCNCIYLPMNELFYMHACMWVQIQSSKNKCNITSHDTGLILNIHKRVMPKNVYAL